MMTATAYETTTGQHCFPRPGTLSIRETVEMVDDLAREFDFVSSCRVDGYDVEFRLELPIDQRAPGSKLGQFSFPPRFRRQGAYVSQARITYAFIRANWDLRYRNRVADPAAQREIPELLAYCNGVQERYGSPVRFRSPIQDERHVAYQISGTGTRPTNDPVIIECRHEIERPATSLPWMAWIAHKAVMTWMDAVDAKIPMYQGMQITDEVARDSRFVTTPEVVAKALAGAHNPSDTDPEVDADTIGDLLKSLGIDASVAGHADIDIPGLGRARLVGLNLPRRPKP